MGPGLSYFLRKSLSPFGVFTFGVVLAATGAAIAQGPPGRDPYNPPPGHGGVPPGQARKYDQNRHNDNGHHDDHRNDRHDDWRFRQDDRNHFYSHYRNDADRWRGRRRPVFVRGQAIPPNYRVQVVPQSYWQGAPPPPPGYQYGYYDGYVVAYNPTTRIIADVLDLVTAAATR
jgi:Ni/Co efflux regulator RcnB